MADNDLDVCPEEDISGNPAKLLGGKFRLHQTNIGLNTVSPTLTPGYWDWWIAAATGDMTGLEFEAAGLSLFGGWWANEVAGKTAPNGDTYALRVRLAFKFYAGC